MKITVVQLTVRQCLWCDLQWLLGAAAINCSHKYHQRFMHVFQASFILMMTVPYC